METLKFVMTTTFYPPYHIGGDAIHVYQLSNELAKLGYEVHVIHSIDSYRWQRKGQPINDYCNHKNVILHSIRSPIGKITPLISYIFGSPFPMKRKIHKIIRDIRPDVLHHHNIAGFGPFILEEDAPRTFYTIHDHWLICPMNGFMKYDGTLCNYKNCFLCSTLSQRPPQIWRYIFDINKKLKHLDIIISPSEYLKNKMKEYKINNRFCVIPNFVPEYPLIGKPLYDFNYLLYVGVLEKHKGILNLINAFIDIRNKVESKLLIAGDGSLKNYILDMINRNELKDKIFLLGRINNPIIMKNIYSNARAVVIPSTIPENCPLVALEAVMNRVPFISSHIGGLIELSGRVKMPTFSNETELKELLLGTDKGNMKYTNDHRIFSSKIFISKYLSIV